MKWTGPANARDYIGIAATKPNSAPYVSYKYTREGNPTPHRLPSGLQIHLRASLGEARPPANAAALHLTGAVAVQAALLEEASLRSLSQQAIDAALIRSRGNISAAARALGVSRGLLYRRLKERERRGSRPALATGAEITPAA